MTDKNEIIDNLVAAIHGAIPYGGCDKDDVVEIANEAFDTMEQHVPHLEKLISGEYVAVPREPTDDIMHYLIDGHYVETYEDAKIRWAEILSTQTAE